MKTTLADAGEEAVMQHDGASIDLAALAHRREQRFQERKARIEADPTLTPQEKTWLLDRTLLGTKDQADMLNRSTNRVTIMRSDRARGRRAPHPMILPEMDAPVGTVAGVIDPGIEAGRLRERLVQIGTHNMVADPQDPTVCVMVRIADYRPGAPRRTRVTRSRPGRPGPSIPGQPSGE